MVKKWKGERWLRVASMSRNLKMARNSRILSNLSRLSNPSTPTNPRNASQLAVRCFVCVIVVCFCKLRALPNFYLCEGCKAAEYETLYPFLVGKVDPLTFSFPSSTMVSMGVVASVICLSRRCAATLPISKVGCDTLVSSIIRPMGDSEKPATAISCGTRRPRLRNSSIQPTAIGSLTVKMASGRSLRLSR